MSAALRILRHPVVAPLFLFNVVQSCAFNHARLAREEGEEQKRHQGQIYFLREQLREARSGRRVVDDVPLLARRCLAVGIDPLSIGLPRDQIPPALLDQGAYLHENHRRLTWSEVFFGAASSTSSSRFLIDKMKEAVGRAAGGLRGQMGKSDAAVESVSNDVGTTAAGDAKTTTAVVDDGQESQDEWEKALLASISSAEAAEQEAQEARRREEEQRREEYARRSREAYKQQYEQLEEARRQEAAAGEAAAAAVPASRRRTMI